MEKVILKYEVNNQNLLVVPRNSEVLDIQLQREIFVVWFLVDLKEEETEERNLEIFMTGETIQYDMGTTRKYLKTLQKGNIVFHIFERIF